MDLPPVIADHLDEIREICRSAGVSRLWLFGSAARGDWREGRSDLDFVVEFDRQRSLAEQFATLYTGLERVLSVRFDLLSADGIRNPHLRADIEASRVLLHAAA